MGRHPPPTLAARHGTPLRKYQCRDRSRPRKSRKPDRYPTPSHDHLWTDTSMNGSAHLNPNIANVYDQQQYTQPTPLSRQASVRYNIWQVDATTSTTSTTVIVDGDHADTIRPHTRTTAQGRHEMTSGREGRAMKDTKTTTLHIGELVPGYLHPPMATDQFGQIVR